MGTVHEICFFVTKVLYTNMDQTLLNSLHGLLNRETGGLDYRAITILCLLYTHVAPIL